MNREIQAFKESVARLIALLEGDETLTPADEAAIASDVARVRWELGLWRKRRAEDETLTAG